LNFGATLRILDKIFLAIERREDLEDFY